MSSEATPGSRPGDGLHGAHQAGPEAEGDERGEGHREDDGRAIGVRHDGPLPPRSFACARRRARCSAFTSGTRRGTVGSMRWLRALLTRGGRRRRRPAPASPATPASRAEKTRRGPTPGFAGSTVRSAIPSGIGVSSLQGAASALAPALRPLARREPRELEPGVADELVDELLADHPRGPQHPTSILLRIVLAPALEGPQNTKPAGGFRRRRRVRVTPVSACSNSPGAGHPYRRRGDSCAFEWPAFRAVGTGVRRMIARSIGGRAPGVKARRALAASSPRRLRVLVLPLAAWTH